MAVYFCYLFVICLIIVSLLGTCDAFHSIPHMRAVRATRFSKPLKMSYLDNALSMIPLCEAAASKYIGFSATSKTTTMNDPTAGMSPEEIVNYISNVGGGMCGYPDWARSAIGVGLNLSLITFGIATVSYVALTGVQFYLEQGVEDDIKSADSAGALAGGASIASMTGDPGERKQFMDKPVDPTEMNRSKRRMRDRIGVEDKKN